MSDTDWHVPVMQKEVQEYLNLSANATFVDCTLGLGGHARLIAEGLGPDGHLIGIDRDAQSLSLAKANLANSVCRKDFVHDDFRNIDKVLDGLKISQVEGMLFDFGISSFQLDKPERGFSIKSDGPLDMRMDQDSFISAYDLVNSLSEQEIASILHNYGEERMSRRIARFLVEERAKKPIESTKELSEIVMRAMPGRLRHQRIHPATRTFQALRIAVNRELESIELALNKCVKYLKKNGRICVIAFHSLEDRIVKQKFRAYTVAQATAQGTDSVQLELVVRKPIRPMEEEVIANPRARSARLRVAQKI